MTIMSTSTGGADAWLPAGTGRSRWWPSGAQHDAYVLRVSCADSAEVVLLTQALGELVLHGDVLDVVRVSSLAGCTALDHRDRVLLAQVRLASAAAARHASRHAEGLTAWAALPHGAMHSGGAAATAGAGAIEQRDPVEPAQPLPDHAVLAGALRRLTGLPATRLATALGVSREQFQRWVAGSPISPARHGQLRYLHALAEDAARRLGREAHPWWRTRGPDGRSPEDLLMARLVEVLHARVAELPDESPVVDGILVTLPLAMTAEMGEYVLEELDDDAQPWSPYDDEALPEA